MVTVPEKYLRGSTWGATGLQPLQQIEGGKGHQDHESHRVEGVNDEEGGRIPGKRGGRWGQLAGEERVGNKSMMVVEVLNLCHVLPQSGNRQVSSRDSVTLTRTTTVPAHHARQCLDDPRRIQVPQILQTAVFEAAGDLCCWTFSRRGFICFP